MRKISLKEKSIAAIKVLSSMIEYPNGVLIATAIHNPSAIGLGDNKYREAILGKPDFIELSLNELIVSMNSMYDEDLMFESLMFLLDKGFVEKVDISIAKYRATYKGLCAYGNDSILKEILQKRNNTLLRVMTWVVPSISLIFSIYTFYNNDDQSNEIKALKSQLKSLQYKITQTTTK